jgi:hypothetical protein
MLLIFTRYVPGAILSKINNPSSPVRTPFIITESWFNNIVVENMAGVFSGLKIEPLIRVSFFCTWPKLQRHENTTKSRIIYLVIFIELMIIICV